MPCPRPALLLCLLALLPLVLLGADTRAFRDISPAEQIEVMRSEARVALVIGNGAYGTAPLANPTRDAKAVAAALREVGFTVELHQDLGNIAMKRALAEFGRALEAGGVGLFYYAGHGIQHDGTNYLVPVDAELNRPDDLEIYGIPADAVLSKMENAANRVNIVILDACRNDPFSRGGGGLATVLVEIRRNGKHRAVDRSEPGFGVLVEFLQNDRADVDRAVCDPRCCG